MANKPFDALIIGSGFGGSFAADRLVAAGLSVALIERGPWRDTAPVRKAGIAERSPLPQGRHALTHLVRQISAPFLPARGVVPNTRGLYDVHLDGDMTIACGSGVGGGSHVYSAYNTRAEVPGYWRNRADGVDESAMDAHYDAVIARMGARVPLPSDLVPNYVREALANDPLRHADDTLAQPAMGFRFGQGQYASNCFLGCADGGKVTLDTLLLAPAMQRGLCLYDLHEAIAFGRDDHGRWWVSMRDHRSGEYRHLLTQRLLLAAGTLNTLRLLFANRARGSLGAMPALGLGFGGNADSIAWWALNQAGADFSLGTPSHGRFAIRGEDDCPYLISVGLNGIDELPLPGLLRNRLKRDLLIVAMGADEANGFATWRNGRLKFHYSVEANPAIARIQAAFATLARRSGKPVYSLARFPVTVHALGGARVDENPARGVVNGRGEVHGLPGLYVVDGAALPGAPAAPPSMSIAAWSAHVADGIAQRAGTARASSSRIREPSTP